MKLRFKKQAYQTEAVKTVTDCFAGQAFATNYQYRIDPGQIQTDPQQQMEAFHELAGFKNHDIALSPKSILENIRKVQRHQNLPQSEKLASNKICPFNLDIEMETGTGKTYCYIKTMFELNKQYGWNKFIVMVPSIAIREGVYKSFQITAEHFLEDYGKRARFFIYNSKQLHELESFSSDAGINVMIINVQAFNATGKDARRIYEELDDFQSRRPIDVISANHPILILDEPQKMEGKKTLDSLTQFKPLMILRYSATHKTEHNKIYRLDALDAYNQKLVKKIAVRGISTKGLSGTNSYLYLESIEVSASKPPIARVEMELQTKNGIKRERRKIGRNDNLQELSDGLNQYKGFVVSDIDALTNTLSFSNGVEIQVGQATGDASDSTIRRIQIREAIIAHFEKEQVLFAQGIKVLSLFFIDEVAKYRQYDDSGEVAGEYAKMFEEEYEQIKTEILGLFDNDPYGKYLNGIPTCKTHNGYFSIDKKNRLVDPKVKQKGEEAGQTDDVDAYDLILKDKERLLSFEEPVRFIFSHSALREGWDNPNVFVIGTLKHSDNTVSRRQEVGRGMRLSVDQFGERMDSPATVHQINVLTVIASESYKDFVTGLQKDISESLSARPKHADEAYFTGKVLHTEKGDITVSPVMAKQIYFYLVQNGYVNLEGQITETYHEDKQEDQVKPLPEDLKEYTLQIHQLIDGVFCEALLPDIADESKSKRNNLNQNFEKKEFQELWQKINQQAVYSVHFETDELITKCIKEMDKELNVSPLQYTIQSGEQKDEATQESLFKGDSFKIDQTQTITDKSSIQSKVKYDLIGKLAEQTKLTRNTIASMLKGIAIVTFNQYKTNPEDFILKASQLINEQKATMIVEHLAYDPINDHHDVDIFTKDKTKDDFGKAFTAKHHIYDYVFYDSKNERKFAEELDSSAEVVVYAKLPRSFFIPTPVGNYNPDWAIAFEQNKVKHVFFIAETKGSMSTLELREIEKSKIECARKFFAKITSEQVRYDVVDGYGKLMNLVMPN
jgi:type III restriction enzyme